MNRGSKDLFTKYGQPFSKWWNQFRAEVTVVAMKDPLEPFMSVGDRILTLRTGYHTRRNSIVVPWMLMLSALSMFFVYDSIPNFDNLQKQVEESLTNFKKYRETGHTPMYDMDSMETYMKALLNKEGKVTALTYIQAQDLRGRGDSVYSTISFNSLMVFLALSVWLVFLLKPRDAEVYFDRQRQIVYTWRHGRVGAAKFDKMGIIENHLSLNIILQFENKKKTGFEPMAIVGIDIGKLAFHKENDMTYTLAQILAFMDHGKEAIITGDTFQREPAKYFLRKDKKPADFERRLEAALKADTDLIEHYQTKKPKGHAF
ncbi:hypothetical protein [Vibrio mexicanus]|uniref:hypothetical protein n=1 Tax=Vibrio mexicanus TaxID=1004326 RepID=UPI00063CF76E|nr:hypothetical protein [Vibrio mexicanus]